MADNSKVKININYIIYGAAAVFFLIILILVFRGCSASTRSPEKIVTALVKNNVSGKTKKAEKCYLSKNGESNSIQTEIDAATKYYTAHGAQGVNIIDCGILSKNKNLVYVYITYNLILKNKQEYPCVGTYMIEKSGKKYYVVPASEITEEMSTQAQEAYVDFMDMSAYLNYLKAYDVFMKKNPGYEEKLIEKIGE